MVEITEVCPEGSTVTETITECVATMTRSICQTSASSLPCYPCIMATTPAAGGDGDDTVTVTVTSCPALASSTDPNPIMTVTIVPCSTCKTTTYTGTVPGYTPGGSCHSCTPYTPTPTPTRHKTETKTVTTCDECNHEVAATNTVPSEPEESCTDVPDAGSPGGGGSNGGGGGGSEQTTTPAGLPQGTQGSGSSPPSAVPVSPGSGGGGGGASPYPGGKNPGGPMSSAAAPTPTTGPSLPPYVTAGTARSVQNGVGSMWVWVVGLTSLVVVMFWM
ncbi:hypothetical protein QBC46DRAFT_381055 [Diplogelasinospora grovesii]|uniref:Uncharacterized protein n=1 Tax=Diplogelasinospora grovesii TaxID=303347 RepID=A0AAN6S6P8_9PEZI|nr:hypothetical protein QBC46DRAFT_381055 [Diplogelasinospora grovesii]